MSTANLRSRNPARSARTRLEGRITHHRPRVNQGVIERGVIEKCVVRKLPWVKKRYVIVNHATSPSHRDRSRQAVLFTRIPNPAASERNNVSQEAVPFGRRTHPPAEFAFVFVSIDRCILLVEGGTMCRLHARDLNTDPPLPVLLRIPNRQSIGRLANALTAADLRVHPVF
jgi:hypothetical protein